MDHNFNPGSGSSAFQQNESSLGTFFKDNVSIERKKLRIRKYFLFNDNDK